MTHFSDTSLVLARLTPVNELRLDAIMEHLTHHFGTIRKTEKFKFLNILEQRRVGYGVNDALYTD